MVAEVNVLLVDDSETEAALVEAQLRADGRCSLVHVDTLAAACDVLRSDGADVVLLDLALPDSMGLATLGTLYRQFPNTPIVVRSRNDDELAMEAVRRGAEDFLPKSEGDGPRLICALRFAVERRAQRLRAGPHWMAGDDRAPSPKVVRPKSDRTDRTARASVLLVEDDSGDAALVGAHLRSSGRFDVTHVGTLAATHDALRGLDRPDVVILDLNLPDSAGLQTFTSLNEQFPDTPFVILSGNEDEELAAAAVAEGAQDYVPKAKAGAEVLTRTLRYAIERQRFQLAEQRHLLLQRDVAIAGEIQQHLLPQRPPAMEGFDIAGVCRAAEACAGDFYDFIELADGRCDVLVADVSSHGFGPALIMASARRMLRTCARMHDDLGRCVTLVNQAVVEDTLDAQFVTLFYTRLDAPTRKLTWCAAGNPAWVIGADGDAKPLEYRGVPLGLIPDCEYTVDGSVTLQLDEIVLLMTDGPWEAETLDGVPFGKQRIFDLIHTHRERPAAEILARVLAEIERFCQPAPPLDDVTLVLLKVVG